ncbi:MAG: DsbA family protein [Rhodospirillales bacterium]|nr:DsbA family protein [Rhodospirillales bacterium]MCB9965625.1 DsbA family protein [Rhodospirillales bacterium]MCB9973048.1 DsbA family protein [Rhodospirillales bacterium]
MTRFLTICALGLLTTSSLTTLSYAEDAPAGLTVAQKDEVNTLIETFIRENPNVIMDSIQQHQIDAQAKAEAEAVEKLNTHKEYLMSDALPHVGNPKGDVKIIEFFDYNCGYCKRAFQDILLLLEADKNVEVIFVDMPILGDSSLEAAKWSLAAEEQDKYFDFHTALMKFSGQKDENSLKTLAEASRLDLAKLEEAAKDKKIVDTIEKHLAVARDLGIGGTPGFIINDQIYRGYLGYDGLKGVIDEIRNAKKDDAAE